MSDDSVTIPWWGKLIIGAVGIGLIAKYTPIVELLSLFFYICMVPILLMMSLGLLSSGSYEALRGGWKKTTEEIRRRVDEKVSEAA
jgi:hypothetical protein